MISTKNNNNVYITKIHDNQGGNGREGTEEICAYKVIHK